MNKVFCKKGLLFSLIFTGYLILFNTSCGLDTFYVINGPKNVRHSPVHSSNDYAENYFEFYVGDANTGIRFLGTDVYYKIYKSSSTLETQVNDLITIANKDESDAAARRMIENYKYQPLRARGHEGDNTLISSSTASNTLVTIRLSDYTDQYLAQITIGSGTSSIGVPVRLTDTTLSFTFTSLTPDKQPKTGDSDVNESGSSSENVWYVSMFALAQGQDATYSPLYSNILYLGSVKIPNE